MSLPYRHLSKKKIGPTLLGIYDLLYRAYGPRHWWPADSPFEVTVGAILTQNTSWSNVEKAISNLKRNKSLNFPALYSISTRKLARLIYSCGYYNIKAKRLKNFIEYLHSVYNGRLDAMFNKPLLKLRHELLSINGIGPETADSIILYAAKKPIFVVDAYTKKIMGCKNIIGPDYSYDDIQRLVMTNLPNKVELFNEYHALLVEHAKTACRAKSKCGICILRKR